MHEVISLPLSLGAGNRRSWRNGGVHGHGSAEGRSNAVGGFMRRMVAASTPYWRLAVRRGETTRGWRDQQHVEAGMEGAEVSFVPTSGWDRGTSKTRGEATIDMESAGQILQVP